MAELKNIRIAVSGIYDYAKEELASLRLSLEDAPEWVEDKPMYRVYRPACVIAKAVDMFKLLPLTHKHPPFPVDGVNFRDLAVGYTGENPRVDYVEEAGEVGIRSTMMMYDDEILSAYENGEIQLSPGYNAVFEWKKGKAPNGEEYDIIMKEITGVNHLALLPKGRGGEFAVVLDGAPETESESADMSIFEFIKIRNELAEYLESMDEDETEDAGKPDGSVSHRKDGDCQKRGGKWYKVYESEGRGASIAAGHVARKIRNAQNVDELMEIVMSNTSRFTGKDGKLLPVVEKLQKAVNTKKTELNAAKTKPEEEGEGQPPEKPAVLGGGRWNGKIYGNEKYGYRIYIDGNEKKISAAQKDEIEKYSSDKTKAEKRAHREAQNREEMKTKFINSVEEVLNKRKERNENEKKVQEARNDRDSIVSKYIKEHGEPDFVKKGYWNGIVYGSPGRYSVYIGGRKKELTESEAQQFGL